MSERQETVHTRWTAIAERRETLRFAYDQLDGRLLGSSRGYVAFVEELPGANAQGATLAEARANLQEAVAMVLEANRILAEESLDGREAIRELLPIA